MGDLAPLVVVGPALNLAGQGAGQVVGGAQVVHVVVQADLVAVFNQLCAAVLYAGDNVLLFPGIYYAVISKRAFLALFLI